MEYSLTLLRRRRYTRLLRLNPYSNGILPDDRVLYTHYIGACLNPYSNGILPDYIYDEETNGCVFVLILILMEYSLTVSINSASAQSVVLILILMEYSLTNVRRYG